MTIQVHGTQEFYPTYPVTEDQMRDITFMIRHLNTLNTAQEERDTGKQWGEGFRAMLTSPIPVRTDARGTQELLGWLVDDEFGWVFTQQPPAMWLQNLAAQYGTVLGWTVNDA